MLDQLQIQLTPAMLVLVPVIGAVVQLLKAIPFVAQNSKWLPYVSIGVALGLGFLTKLPEPIISSVILGLAASGSYDLVKSSTK